MSLTPQARKELIEKHLAGDMNAMFLKATLPQNIGHWLTLSKGENLIYVGEGFKPVQGGRLAEASFFVDTNTGEVKSSYASSRASNLNAESTQIHPAPEDYLDSLLTAEFPKAERKKIPPNEKR